MSRADRVEWIRARKAEGHPHSTIYDALTDARRTGGPRGRPRDPDLNRCHACGQATQSESAAESAARHEHLETELCAAIRGGDWAGARALADKLWPPTPPTPPTPLKLSRSHAKEADRVGGIELMVLWPDALGPEPLAELPQGSARDPTDVERVYAEAIAAAACEANDLVLAAVEVVHAQRPDHKHAIAGDEWHVHLGLHLVGRRWINASRPTRPPPLRWHELSPRHGHGTDS